MAMMNNPILSLIQLAQNGGNPMQLLQQMAGSNPAAQQTLRMINGKTPAQMRQVAENMARERGIDLNEMARRMGLPLR